TRDSLLTLAGDLGLVTEERPVTVEEWREGVTSGRITEVFASGTAAVVMPIGCLRWRDGEIAWGGDSAGPIATTLRDALLDLQCGRLPDRYGWLHPVCP
ncbi:MAG TPA: branched chain amino acid aminotransferase, partial [Actinopolymorphaceae bacterium]